MKVIDSNNTLIITKDENFVISNLNVVKHITDFKWLFDFLSLTIKEFKIFKDCKVQYENKYEENSLTEKVIHTFPNGLTLESCYYSQFSECNTNTSVEEILDFISKETNIPIEYIWKRD